MKYESAKPLPVTLTEQIENMPAKRSMLVPASEASVETVRTIVWRLGAKHPERKYQTAKEDGGVRIWRTT